MTYKNGQLAKKMEEDDGHRVVTQYFDKGVVTDKIGYDQDESGHYKETARYLAQEVDSTSSEALNNMGLDPKDYQLVTDPDTGEAYALVRADATLTHADGVVMAW